MIFLHIFGVLQIVYCMIILYHYFVQLLCIVILYNYFVFFFQNHFYVSLSHSHPYFRVYLSLYAKPSLPGILTFFDPPKKSSIIHTLLNAVFHSRLYFSSLFLQFLARRTS